MKGLLAAEADQGGKCSETMKFLLSRQYPDGSFHNLGATIYALPSLVGALPLDMREIACPKNTPGKYTCFHFFFKCCCVALNRPSSIPFARDIRARTPLRPGAMRGRMFRRQHLQCHCNTPSLVYHHDYEPSNFSF